MNDLVAGFVGTVMLVASLLYGHAIAMGRQEPGFHDFVFANVAAIGCVLLASAFVVICHEIKQGRHSDPD